MNRRRFLTASAALAASSALPRLSFGATAHAGYRGCAYIADGRPDPDDIGSIAMALALIGKAGLQRGLLNCTYNCQPESGHPGMKISVDGSYTRWNLSAPRFDASTSSGFSAAVNNLAALISASRPGAMLGIIAAGPMELIYRALADSAPQAHPFATILTHSIWNNERGEPDLNDIKGQFNVGVEKIPDQNARLRKTFAEYDWLRTSSDEKLRFIYGRMERPDHSDAGMMYFALHNNKTPTIADLRAKLTA